MLTNRTSLLTSAAVASGAPERRAVAAIGAWRGYGIYRIAAGASEAAMKYGSLFFCSLSLLLNVATASAQELSPEEMACALNPQCTTPFVDRRLRSVTTPTSPRPPLSFDITLNFAFDSAELTSDSREKLDRVARAITDPSTSKFDIIVSGHTDARGTTEYNQGLSERRAEAARQYLITQHGIDAIRLVAKGYGKSQLLLPSDPNNDLNRRVQFQNAIAASTSPSPTTTSKSPEVTRPAAGGDGL
jgi:outer membrane protein OmpA-like peptidoglycan-associated protein